MAFTITSQMIEHVQAASAARFVHALAVWLSDHGLMPEDWDENEVQRFVRLAVQGAWDRDFEQEIHIAQYAALAAVLGLHFDLQDELAELTAPLRDGSLSDDDRIGMTVERIAARLEADDPRPLHAIDQHG